MSRTKEITKEVCKDICEQYCKYPADPEMTVDKLINENCVKCPLKRLFKM